jgi:Rhomboid family
VCGGRWLGTSESVKLWRTGRPWGTWLLAAANVVTFLVAPAFATAVLAQEGWPQLAAGVFFLLLIGSAVEERFGPPRFVLFCVLCGFLSVRGGAAGAVSGVIGAYLVLHPRARALPVGPVVVAWFALQWLIAPDTIGYAALGSVAGLFATLPLLRRRPRDAYRPVSSRSGGTSAGASGSGRGNDRGSGRGTQRVRGTGSDRGTGSARTARSAGAGRRAGAGSA